MGVVNEDEQCVPRLKRMNEKAAMCFQAPLCPLLIETDWKQKGHNEEEGCPVSLLR